MTTIEEKRKEVEMQDSHIANVAITMLKGQAQWDFLTDYFRQIRKESVEMARKEFIEILNTRVRRRFNLIFAKDSIENNNWFIDTIINDFRKNELKQCLEGSK